MTDDSSNARLTTYTWVACLMTVTALGALAIMTKRLDRTIEQAIGLGFAISPLTEWLFKLPRYVYVLVLAGLTVGLIMNMYLSASPGRKLGVNLVLATIAVAAAWVVWCGTSLFLVNGVRGLTQAG
jgi:hypothetical protein